MKKIEDGILTHIESHLSIIQQWDSHPSTNGSARTNGQVLVTPPSSHSLSPNPTQPRSRKKNGSLRGRAKSPQPNSKTHAPHQQTTQTPLPQPTPTCLTTLPHCKGNGTSMHRYTDSPKPAIPLPSSSINTISMFANPCPHCSWPSCLPHYIRHSSSSLQ